MARGAAGRRWCEGQEQGDRVGRGDKAIARNPVRTTCTVEGHLSAVCRKLGIAGRRDPQPVPVIVQ
jgi:hypothetical protein